MEFLLLIGVMLIPVGYLVIRWAVRYRRAVERRAPQRELTATDAYLEKLAQAVTPDEVADIEEKERRRRGE